MACIDYGLAYDFIDPNDGIPRQLRFERNYGPPGHRPTFTGTGQLVAVVAEAGRPDNGHTLALTRPDVNQAAVDQVIDGWQDWAMLSDREVNLAEIRRRVRAARLD